MIEKVMGVVVVKFSGDGGSMRRRRGPMKGLRCKEFENYRENDERKRERVLP